MTILTTFLAIGFASTFISLCWINDKYFDTLNELDSYKHQVRFLENQIKENRRIYKNALQSYKSRVKRNVKEN